MDITEQWFQYLHKERKLSLSIIQSAGLFTNLGRLAIPVKDREGKIIFHKYRKAPWAVNDEPKYKYEAGSSTTIFNLHTVKDNDEIVYITEGELDALALQSCGYTAVSSTGGAGKFPDSLEHLSGHPIKVWFDNDDAGLKGAAKLALQFPRPWEFIFTPPAWGKDSGDVLGEYGEEKIHEIIHQPVIPLEIPNLQNKNQIKQLRVSLQRRLGNYDSVGHIHVLFLRQVIIKLQELESAHKKVKRTDESGGQIKRAKAYPIKNLLQFNRENKVICPFHKEDTASLTYYEKTNSTFCFGGCQRHYDSIDIYAEQNELDPRRDFLKIVAALNEL